jgi:thiol-disulfide isomerase/thioredoxin
MIKMLCVLPILFSIFSADTLKAPANSRESNNQIVFIFKKNDREVSSKFKTIDGSSNPIYISEKGDFKRSEILINNKLKADTLTKLLKEDVIYLTYFYDAPKGFYYQFQKGDTVVFDYDNGIPRATVLGRETKKFDSNFEASFNIEKPLDDFDFYYQHSRKRNELENKTYKKDLHNYQIQLVNSLDSLYTKDLISKSVMEFYKGRNKYYEINTNKELLATISNEDLKRDDLLPLKTYQLFIENYVSNALSHTATKSQAYDPKIAFDYILKNTAFSSKIKDFLLYTNTCRLIESLPQKESEVYFQRFRTAVTNKELVPEISNKYAFDFLDLKKEKKVTYLIDNNKKKFTLEEVLTKNKNKVIYVDFWASWCGPCRAAMPSFSNLKKEYNDKEIVFINISIDKDMSAWKMASDKEKLSLSGTSFFAVNYPNALFYQGLQLKTIPRYLLYNKKGQLINNNAPHPNSEEIAHELDRLLKE